MPVLVISTPERPDVVVPLEGEPLVLGRGERADVRIEDPKVSSEHLRVSRLDDGTWVAQDLGSTSGTKVGSRRVLRAALEVGDVVTIGLTRVRYLAEAPRASCEPPAALVGGTLGFKPVAAAPPKPAPAQEPAPEPEPPAEPAPEADAGREAPAVVTRPLDARSMSRALVLVLVGLLVVGVVELVLGPKAREAEERAQERRDLRDRIQRSDISPDTFAQEVDIFLAKHPDADEKDALLRYLAGVRAMEAGRLRRESMLNAIAGGLHDMPESEVRGQLLELQRRLPGDEDMALQARLALETLDRRHASAEASALDATLDAARTLVAAHDPAAALRRLSAFRNAWPAPSPDALERLRKAEDGAIEAANSLLEHALAAGESITDPVERRRALGAAWRGLEGTPQGDRVAEALRFTRSPTRTPGGTTPTPGTPSVPEEPDVGDEMLAKAAAVEQLVFERHWPEALLGLKELIDRSDAGPLQREWIERSKEIRYVVGLVDALQAAASGEHPPRPTLSTGRVTVTRADGDGVDLLVGDSPTHVAWGDLQAADVLTLLTPKKPDDAERFGLAVLAASLSLRDGVVAALLPLFESDGAHEEASRLVARHLYGRSEPPPGGYRAYKGEILDREGYERRMKAERVAALRAQAEDLLAQVLKQPVFKKLEKLAERREELDKRRRYALLAIFNEKHYPYPYVRGSEQYREVQQEIDRRVAAVREIWDDPAKVTITRKGQLDHALGRWEANLAELKRLDADVSDLEAKIAPYVAYATGEPITIREYFKDEKERRLLAYNRWVMEVYNPRQDREATQAERRQTRVTNEYRMMMAYAVVVAPGRAPYEAIDEDTVVRILDEATIVMDNSPLTAVRIDDRLVRSARGHSLDMQKRSFFNHYAPPNPATGEPRTSPFDRMQKAGYKGGGASENIAQGATSPEGAHDQWVHSSGHHRNILSPWYDQGVGQAGRLWTQNFGIGGGKPPVIEPDAAPGDGKADGNGDDGAGDPKHGRR